MRLLLALAVVALALVAWLAFAPLHSAPHQAAPAPDSLGKNVPSVDRNATTLDVPSDLNAPMRAVERPVVKEAVAIVTGPTCRVLGRIVDDLGAPIAGARLVLKEWGEFPEATAAHETVSGTDGAFRLEIAAPASAKQSLSITARPFHISTERWFGDVKVAEGRTLTGGDVDVGTIELARCGTVEGRVLSDAGVPVDDVGVLLWDAQSGARGGKTDANGAYSIPEVLPGRWLVTVKHLEWLPPAQTFVNVEALRVTTAPDLVLSSAPSIQGLVVDVDGAPLPWISVEGLGQGGFATTRAISDENGSFVLRLPDREPVTLNVGGTCAHQSFGGRRDDPTCTFAPGARGVRIVLERAPVMTFHVVDAVTRAPVERYGLWVACRGDKYTKDTGASEERTIQDHPGGATTRTFGEFAKVHVDAPGYAPLELAVIADPSSASVQTIALLRASSITGRVLVLGKPVPGAKVCAAREDSANSGSVQWRPKASGKEWNYEFDLVLAEPHGAVSAEDGAFTIDDLAAGTYRLAILAPRGARTLLRALVVPPEGVLALGDVVIAPEASVRGVVLTPHGKSPVGCTITLEDFRDARVSTEDGRFEFTGLAPGAHWLVWRLANEKRELDSGDPRRVDFVLGAGETRDIVIDATASEPCAVTVHVNRHGMPVEGAVVNLRWAPDSVPQSAGWRALGRTDREGLVTGTADGGRRARIFVFDDSKHVIGSSASDVELVSGGRHVCTVEITTGRLEVQLPAALARPEYGRIRVIFAGDGPPALTAFADSLSPSGPRPSPKWASSLVDFGDVQAGVLDVEIRCERYERDTTTDNPKAGRWIELRAPFSAHVEIKDGETTRLVVP